MSEVKTWVEAHENERFGDGGILDSCKQCKTCMFQSDGTVWSNDYRKGCCKMFSYPDTKPPDVAHNTAKCEYYEKAD
jgi:hypothetical protein